MRADDSDLPDIFEQAVVMRIIGNRLDGDDRNFPTGAGEILAPFGDPLSAAKPEGRKIVSDEEYLFGVQGFGEV